MVLDVCVGRLLFNGGECLLLQGLEGRAATHFVLDAAEYVQIGVRFLGRGAGTILVDPHDDTLALWLSRLSIVR